MGQYKIRGLVFVIAALFVLTDCGGTQGSPESVARAYLESARSGDCAKVQSLFSPDRASLLNKNCQKGVPFLTEYRIDNVVVRDASFGRKTVTFVGMFKIDDPFQGIFASFLEDEPRQNLTVPVEEIDGKWYVSDYVF